ncbi:hypothetical protein C5167_026851 [Papaver somniferum]|nr:hypothetical protein C5167_026851 [Papaver somniferum]
MQDDLVRHKLKLDSSFSRKSLEKELKDLEEIKGVLKREMKVAKHSKS